MKILLSATDCFESAAADPQFLHLQTKNQTTFNKFVDFSVVDKILRSELPAAIPRKERNSRKSNEIELIHRQASVEDRYLSRNFKSFTS